MAKNKTNATAKSVNDFISTIDNELKRDDAYALIKIYQSINQLEKSKVQLKTYDHYTNQFFPFLIAGIILIFFEILLRYTLFRKFP